MVNQFKELALLYALLHFIFRISQQDDAYQNARMDILQMIELLLENVNQARIYVLGDLVTLI